MAKRTQKVPQIRETVAAKRNGRPENYVAEAVSSLNSKNAMHVPNAEAEPDLLQTLKDLLAQIADTCKSRKFNDGPLCLAAEAARAVVRKAEGRAT